MRISISVFWNHKIDRGFGTKVRRYEGTFYEGTKVPSTKVRRYTFVSFMLKNIQKKPD